MKADEDRDPPAAGGPRSPEGRAIRDAARADDARDTRAPAAERGPAAEHDLVLRGRLEGQAPEIDPLVYLTDCDPSALSPGQFVQAEIVASRGYDLVVRPVTA